MSPQDKTKLLALNNFEEVVREHAFKGSFSSERASAVETDFYRSKRVLVCLIFPEIKLKDLNEIMGEEP